MGPRWRVWRSAAASRSAGIGHDLAGHLGHRVTEAVQHEHPLVRARIPPGQPELAGRLRRPVAGLGRGAGQPGVVLGLPSGPGPGAQPDGAGGDGPDGPLLRLLVDPHLDRSRRRAGRQQLGLDLAGQLAQVGGVDGGDRPLPLRPHQRQRVADRRDDLGLRWHDALQAEQRGHVATQPAGAPADGDDRRALQVVIRHHRGRRARPRPGRTPPASGGPPRRPGGAARRRPGRTPRPRRRRPRARSRRAAVIPSALARRCW